MCDDLLPVWLWLAFLLGLLSAAVPAIWFSLARQPLGELDA